ncbi:hypothetical protein [Noviherbaspirillum aridicola]|uniref:Response regulatory domain-containing protein n=1 Tax=Noviherbaspirillum aridicola TaxID=2849687 RepID=A0ABQ4QA94_9BURK|nr:hypothetical protein [Noviherbaspirillum aridicola]GIZ53705.1 hypothetical protein NCCP691_37190 [Noviherbaspirillum aridicola]
MLQNQVALVADPDPQISELLSEMLRIMKCTAIPVMNAHEASRITNGVIFDFAVMSVDPHSSQLDLSLIVSTRAKQPHVKVIGISSDINEPTNATKTQVDIFLRKPFNFEQLDSAIRSVIDVGS